MSAHRPRALFVTYNGLIEPLGATQIIPYVRGLARDYDMSILSFEKKVRSGDEDARDRRRLEAALRDGGVDWIQLRYHKWPSLPATLYDIAHGLLRIKREHRRNAIRLVHARGYVPGAIAWGLKRSLGIPYLFDIRGLQAEEYVDAGHWHTNDVRFRLTKNVEQRILFNADALVTLTEAIRPILWEFPGLRARTLTPPWEVIPCCVDLDHFRFRCDGRRKIRENLRVGNRPVLVYAGSLGTWYLMDEMLAFYTSVRKVWPELFFLLLINGSGRDVTAKLSNMGLTEHDAAVRWARFEELPDYLSAADVGIAFIRSCLSKRSSSPTKFAEYLACGLPVITNPGIGDADRLIEQEGAGLLVRGFDPAAYAKAGSGVSELLSRGRDFYRRIAEKQFSLSNKACPAYRRLYRQIIAAPSAPAEAQEPGAPS